MKEHEFPLRLVFVSDGKTGFLADFDTCRIVPLATDIDYQFSSGTGLHIRVRLKELPVMSPYEFNKRQGILPGPTCYLCPVCYFPYLEDPPENHTICPYCGTHFDYDDCATSHEELRNEWIANGRKIFSEQGAVYAARRSITIDSIDQIVRKEEERHHDRSWNTSS